MLGTTNIKFTYVSSQGMSEVKIRFSGRTGSWVEKRGHGKSSGLYFLVWRRKLKSSIKNGIFCTPQNSISTEQSSLIVRGHHTQCLEVAGALLLFLMCVHQVRRKVMIQKTVFMRNQRRFSNIFRKYHMKILLGDSYAKLGTEGIFKPTIGNDSLQKVSIDNGVRIINFAKSKNLVVKSTMFPHRNIHQYI